MRRTTRAPRAACRFAMRDRLIVALDFVNLASAVRMATRLQGLVRTVKVGSALFTAAGPRIIQRLRGLGFQVMLDLKFFDIPSTVELSCRAAVHHRVTWLTVHAGGGQAMLESAVRGIREEARCFGMPRPGVLAVTVLTSVRGGLAGQLAQRQGSSAVHLTHQVRWLAEMALRAGCDGVVASAHEARTLRKRFGNRVHIVCPGIRPARAYANDQQRVCTPREALVSGADFLVVGRPITAASNPRSAVHDMLKEMEESDGC